MKLELAFRVFRSKSFSMCNFGPDVQIGSMTNGFVLHVAAVHNILFILHFVTIPNILFVLNCVAVPNILFCLKSVAVTVTAIYPWTPI
jgi:hypothetical protein